MWGGSSLKPTMDDFFKVIHSVLLISGGTTSLGVGSPLLPHCFFIIIPTEKS